jgi:hypothetical protein
MVGRAIAGWVVEAVRARVGIGSVGCLLSMRLAVLADRERFTGRRTATIVCGSNVMTSDFERWTLA